jgi:hypothetical protein
VNRQDAKELSRLRKARRQALPRINRRGESQADVDLRCKIERICKKQADMLASKICITCGEEKVETDVVPDSGGLSADFGCLLPKSSGLDCTREIAAFTSHRLKEAITPELIFKLLFEVKEG